MTSFGSLSVIGYLITQFCSNPTTMLPFDPSSTYVLDLTANCNDSVPSFSLISSSFISIVLITYSSSVFQMTSFVSLIAYTNSLPSLSLYYPTLSIFSTPIFIFRLSSILSYPKLSTCRSCLLYTSPSPRDRQKSRMPSSA